jgi:endonuclease YncB( thermonuclease family)
MTKNQQFLSITEREDLLQDLQQIIAKGKTKTNNQTVHTYWQVGQKIFPLLHQHSDKYQATILKELNKKLEMEPRTLRTAMILFAQNETPPKNDFLKWTHYRQLLSVKDLELRNKLQEQTIANSWNVRQLAAAIKAANQNYTNPELDEGQTALQRPTAPTYLYKAKIVDVVDGDTLVLLVDLGFDVHKKQRVRLAAIDCPEMDSPEGQEAYQFVHQLLANVPFVMVQTRKVDIYGRFIGHVFFDAEGGKNKEQIFTHGSYLNEEILQAGMGVKV